jgi:hypothetical protein
MLRNVTKGRGSNETAEPDIANMARPMTHLPHRPASGRILSAYSLVAPTGDQVHCVDDGCEAVKNPYPKGAAKGIFTIRLSRNLLIPLKQAGTAALALLRFRRYISPTFPGKNGFKNTMNGRQFIYHMQGLTKTFPP